MRVGALDVSILVDGEGSFATVAEVFPRTQQPRALAAPG
jgi:hypothetical protein